MKTISILCYLLTFCIDYTDGQRRDTVYYDKNWKVIETKNFEFYRVTFQDSGNVQVTDYYKSGKIQMTGTYKSFNFSDPTGQFSYYKKNGHLDYQVINDPFKYPNLLSPYLNYLKLLSPLPDSFSIEISYRPGGSIWGIGYVRDSCSCRSRRLYMSKKGNLWFQMSFLNNKKDGRYIQYTDNKKSITGQFKTGKKDGEWVFYNNDGSIKFKEYYLKGEKIR
jgi:hypothetical protein